MIVELMYFGLGFLFALAFKYEVDQRKSARKIAKRAGYIRTVASSNKVQESDDVLATIRHINEGLSALNNNQGKGAR